MKKKEGGKNMYYVELNLDFEKRKEWGLYIEELDVIKENEGEYMIERKKEQIKREIDIEENIVFKERNEEMIAEGYSIIYTEKCIGSIAEGKLRISCIMEDIEKGTEVLKQAARNEMQKEYDRTRKGPKKTVAGKKK